MEGGGKKQQETNASKTAPHRGDCYPIIKHVADFRANETTLERPGVDWLTVTLSPANEPQTHVAYSATLGDTHRPASKWAGQATQAVRQPCAVDWARSLQ